MLNCPDCGAPMSLRTARRGRNSGGQFYGCTRYPQCRATLPLEAVTVENAETDDFEVPKDQIIPSSPIQFPQFFRAQSLFEGCESRFIESGAVPEELLIKLRDEPGDVLKINGICQWRMDYTAAVIVTPAMGEKRIISQMEKILTRGRLTLLSPLLETKLKKLFGNPQVGPQISALNGALPEVITDQRILSVLIA